MYILLHNNRDECYQSYPSVCIAKDSSTKYIPFHIMYNRDPITPFELAYNQRHGNAIEPVRESVTINDHITKMEHIYQCMHAKSHSSI